MTERLRREWLTALERNKLWQLWHRGLTLAEIGEALKTTFSAVAQQISRAGGVAPCPRKRRPDALTDMEREEISRGLGAKLSLRAIAKLIGRAPSTISREINRNAGHRQYRAVSAERRAWRVAHRPKPCKLACEPRLRRLVAAKLRQRWAPQQIAGWLRATFASPNMHVSHETIYRTLFVQARGALKKELVAYLRTQRVHRKPRSPKVADTASIVDGVHIRERPAEVEDRAVPGHWEGDLLFGTQDSWIVTLVERTTRFCLLGKLTAKDTVTVTAAIKKQIRRLPSELKKTLTWDRGSEMSGHKAFAVATGIDVYFCDPRSPWQRGSNENTNGLLRQYFPKGKDVSHYSQAELDKVAKQLNGRPRMTLDFKTPAEKLQQLLR